MKPAFLILAAGILAFAFLSGCAETLNGSSIDSAVEFCGKLGNDQSQHSCFIGIAAAERNPLICARHSGQDFQDVCFSQLAAFLNDIRQCGNIIDSNVKENCYYGAAESIADCGKISDAEIREGCLHFLAIRKKDSQICGFIPAQIHSEKCVQDVASGATTHD